MELYRIQPHRVQGIRMHAEALFGLNEKEETPTHPTIWNVPHLRNLYLTGREQVLAYLHETLNSKKTVAITQARAISGLGGIGKTQIAVEYTYRYGLEAYADLLRKTGREGEARPLVERAEAIRTSLRLKQNQF